MKKVNRTGQMRVRTSGQTVKKNMINTDHVKRDTRPLVNPLAGKSGGTGLDDYNLDIMILE